MRILLNALAHYLFVPLIFPVTLTATFSIILYPYFFYSSSSFLSLIHFNNLCLKITILFLKFHLRKLKNIGNPRFWILQIESKLNEHGMIQRQKFYENCYVLSLFIQHIVDFCAFLIIINISHILVLTNKFYIVLWDLIWFFFY